MLPINFTVGDDLSIVESIDGNSWHVFEGPGDVVAVFESPIDLQHYVEQIQMEGAYIPPEIIDTINRRAVEEEAIADPEFGSDPDGAFVLSEGPNGFLLSNGTFVQRTDPLTVPDEPGWLARAFYKFIGCR